MKEITTPYGKVLIGTEDAIYRQAVSLVESHCQKNDLIEPTLALSGGGTAQGFFRACVKEKLIPEKLSQKAAWFVSDERMVPFDSDESNFGNAERLLLDPLDVPFEKRHPWPTDHSPDETVALFGQQWKNQYTPFACFDICFLGMGDDCHTASIFPHSPLLAKPTADFFAHVEVPAKGHRLTITPAGLRKCGLIVVMVIGEAKAIPVEMAMGDLHDPSERPIQILREEADRVVWLVEEKAAARLGNK